MANYIQNNNNISSNIKIDMIASDWNLMKDNKFFNSYKVENFEIVNNHNFSMQSKTFDLILGADILYEIENYKTLIDLFDYYLTENGSAIIITKMYYYGNGGSLYEFQDYVDQSKLFTYKTLKIINNNSSNRREIILLERIQVP